jgi:hypothetical protein
LGFSPFSAFGIITFGKSSWRRNNKKILSFENLWFIGERFR